MFSETLTPNDFWEVDCRFCQESSEAKSAKSFVKPWDTFSETLTPNDFGEKDGIISEYISAKCFSGGPW